MQKKFVSTAGAAGKLPKPLSWKKMREIAREDRLKEKYGKQDKMNSFVNTDFDKIPDIHRKEP